MTEVERTAAPLPDAAKMIRVCSHYCVDNHRKQDEPGKNNVKLIVAGKNSAKPLQAAEKAFDLVAALI